MGFNDEEPRQRTTPMKIVEAWMADPSTREAVKEAMYRAREWSTYDSEAQRNLPKLIRCRSVPENERYSGYWVTMGGVHTVYPKGGNPTTMVDQMQINPTHRLVSQVCRKVYGCTVNELEEGTLCGVLKVLWAMYIEEIEYLVCQRVEGYRADFLDFYEAELEEDANESYGDD